MLEEGYYHSDPHPGNLLRTVDGDLAYIVRSRPGISDTTHSVSAPDAVWTSAQVWTWHGIYQRIKLVLNNRS